MRICGIDFTSSPKRSKPITCLECVLEGKQLRTGQLCAIQAAWAWTKREDGYGEPNPVDPLEGWIADPTICSH